MSEVVLKNKQKFIDILDHYKMSEHAHGVLHDVEYVVLIGPAAAGRNTIIRELVKTDKYKFIVSDTTRPPKFRDGKMEEHGINYFFRSEEDLLNDLENGEFLEAELIHRQQVSGTSIRELEAARDQGKIAINEVEHGGAKNVLAAKPDSKVLAIIPSSFEVWQQRFSAREKISKTEFQNRIRTAKEVIELSKSDDRIEIVINHDYHEAAKFVDEHLHGREFTEEERQEAAAVIADFEQNIEKLIASF